MKLNSKQYQKLFIFILILLFFGNFYPLVYNLVLFGHYRTYISILALLVWSFYAFIIKRSKFSFPIKSFNVIILIQFVFFLLWGIVHSSQSFINQGISILLGWYAIFLTINTIGSITFINIFTKVNIASLILSIVGLILVTNGVLGLYSVHEYAGDHNIYNYLFFFIKRADFTDLNIRVAGYYDEPGSLAYVVLFLLLINRKYFGNIKREYMLLFLPLVTTSLAHVITLLVFISFYYLNLKNIKRIVFLIVLGFFLLIILNTFENTDYGQYFRGRTIDRLEGFLQGESDAGRKGGLELGPELFDKYYLTGTSPESVRIKYPDFVGETFWGPLINYGIFGIFIFYLPFIYIFVRMLKNRNKEEFLAILLIAMNLLQRPSYIYPLYILLIYILFFSFEKKRNVLHEPKSKYTFNNLKV